MDKVGDNTLARSIEALYAQECVHKFPYEDCRTLRKLQPNLDQNLTADLNSYFMFIAGYSSGATRLGQRPQAELRAALPRLKRTFYEVFPKYQTVSEHITDNGTPSLFHELEVADRLRRGLVTLISDLLSEHF
jgi:YxiJ-like protein